MKTQEELQQTGFTQSGAKRYTETVEAYALSLHDKSVIYAQVDKATDTNLEVTHDHVRAAAHNLASSFGRDQPSPMIIPIQIGEYLFTAGAGVGGGCIKEWWGLPLFVLSIAIAVILFVVRNTVRKN